MMDRDRETEYPIVWWFLRRRKDRPDPPRSVLRPLERSDIWCFLILIIAFTSGWMLIPALKSTSLHFSSPIDDAYIHAVYARNLTQGMIFIWSEDAGYSLGATSALYPLILAVGYLVGFRGQFIMLFAIFNLAACLVALRYVIYLVSRSSIRDGLAWLAAFLTLFNGCFLVNMLSGMETGVCLGLLGWFLVNLQRDLLSPLSFGPRRMTLFSAALIPIARPDWLLLILPSILMICFLRRTDWKLTGIRRFILILLPLGAWYLLNWLNTGFMTSNAGGLKWIWNDSMSHQAHLKTFTQQLASIPWLFMKTSYGKPLACILVIVFAVILAFAIRLAGQRHRLFHGSLFAGVLIQHLFLANIHEPGNLFYRYYMGAAGPLGCRLAFPRCRVQVDPAPYHVSCRVSSPVHRTGFCCVPIDGPGGSVEFSVTAKSLSSCMAVGL
jgi:hypothetical protein